MEELEALVALTRTPYLGPVKMRALLKRFGSGVEAIKASPSQVEELPGFTARIMQHWGKWDLQELRLVEEHHADIISYDHPSYPKRLLEIPDHPILLYVKGEILPADEESIAVVGTRNATIYGREMTALISKELAREGFTIVSGLARGIDTVAHESALKAGRTIGVIGSGLANIYPRENIRLAEQMSQNGAVMSEFPMKTPPDRHNFPQRNRIVSGMTLGTLLIEAPEKSGAMITMRMAREQGRKCFALPGRSDNENYKGNHLLIKSGKANLIDNASDIIQNFKTLTKRASQPTKVQLSEEEQNLLSQLPKEEQNIEEIQNLTNLPIMKLNVLLMGLVIKQVVKEYPGKMYKKMI